jgi:hypothetical protein
MASFPPGHAKPADFFCNMPLLLDAIGNANVMIVVSSSSRFQLAYTEIECLFPQEIRGKLNGITGDAFIGQHARWHEIQTFAFANCGHQPESVLFQPE